jgi:hypothetical protein
MQLTRRELGHWQWRCPGGVAAGTAGRTAGRKAELEVRRRAGGLNVPYNFGGRDMDPTRCSAGASS